MKNLYNKIKTIFLKFYKNQYILIIYKIIKLK